MVSQFIIDAAERSGGRIAFVSTIAPTRTPPGLGLFEAILVFARAIRESLEVTYLVFEGTGGFWQTIVRSVTTRVVLATRMRDAVTYVDSFEVALARACAPRGLDSWQLRSIVDREGLFEGGEADPHGK
jgi:hypothetical protein